MREIKFRGKRIDNGEWVYGSLTTYSQYMSYIEVDLLENEIYSVLSDTVGQYTGLKDKNGVEIYEGDKLQDERGNIITCLFEIQDSHSSFKFIDKKRPARMYCNISTFFEIIGNIHDKEKRK